ncbi:3-deoxy-D-manno-octulosonic acid transferase [Thalassobius sp. Cn5-15]|uniref:3-deoxy-D-manno-octulosonic acid transferase n=1 Tax=Thalassobius sp. Cn5-15 TaxID=2917763 RepID=UPI001EF39F40|nr:glycosyltransferase N-terminal domain-containing protein [Thalassobius sp. Cn5-15]MCG7495152.1 3-deoxy-D-manno-octulosonic acid transferase [Thalassobius sp. Cn5-15]
MPRSLSLTAYMALARRGAASPQSFDLSRPAGEVIWAHANSLQKAASLIQLFTLLEVQRPGLHLLLTTAPGLSQPDHLKSNMYWQVIPEDTAADVTRFLDHWQPDLCLWTSGDLRPAAIEMTARRKIPLLLLDAEASALEDARFRWLPDMSRTLLQRFARIIAVDEAAAQRLGRIGITRKAVRVLGTLQEGGGALTCDEATREDLAKQLGNRPVWLAAMAQMDELGMIGQAHKAALRLSHRQLLILVPDNPEDGSQMADRLRRWGWRLAIWSEGQQPDEDTQILLADTYGEMGLWYRLAPVTFMGSSLVPGFGGRDPYEPAALGSAILYGPNVGRYLSAYSRFVAAGAARIVKDADSLASALATLSAAEQVAAMAHAGWDVSSAGAEVTDEVIEMIHDALDLGTLDQEGAS